MKLQALDQIHVSSVKADALRPNEQFECSDVLGAELLNKHPTKFKKLAEPKNKAAPKASNKAAP